MEAIVLEIRARVEAVSYTIARSWFQGSIAYFLSRATLFTPPYSCYNSCAIISPFPTLEGRGEERDGRKKEKKERKRRRERMKERREGGRKKGGGWGWKEGKEEKTGEGREEVGMEGGREREYGTGKYVVCQ